MSLKNVSSNSLLDLNGNNLGDSDLRNKYQSQQEHFHVFNSVPLPGSKQDTIWSTQR